MWTRATGPQRVCSINTGLMVNGSYLQVSDTEVLKDIFILGQKTLKKELWPFLLPVCFWPPAQNGNRNRVKEQGFELPKGMTEMTVSQSV